MFFIFAGYWGLDSAFVNRTELKEDSQHNEVHSLERNLKAALSQLSECQIENDKLRLASKQDQTCFNCKEKMKGGAAYCPRCGHQI
jgi:hypothetical protein